MSNKIQVEHIQECVCGAVTVTFHNGATNSMTHAKFESMHFEGEQSPTKFCCCNHCVNHWGIDLCECGSGQFVGECECGSTEASEVLGVKREFVGWAF